MSLFVITSSKVFQKTVGCKVANLSLMTSFDLIITVITQFFCIVLWFCRAFYVWSEAKVCFCLCVLLLCHTCIHKPYRYFYHLLSTTFQALPPPANFTLTLCPLLYKPTWFERIKHPLSSLYLIGLLWKAQPGQSEDKGLKDCSWESVWNMYVWKCAWMKVLMSLYSTSQTGTHFV